DDVRTPELRSRLRLPLETFERAGRRGAHGNDLERDVDVELHMVRAPERPHATGSDLLDDLVALAQPVSGSHHVDAEPYHARVVSPGAPRGSGPRVESGRAACR